MNRTKTEFPALAYVHLIACILLVSLSLSLSLSLSCPGARAGSESAEARLEKDIARGQTAFDKGEYSRAERDWLRVEKKLLKQDPGQRLAGLSQKLGDCYFKQAKYPLADTAYKKSLELLDSSSQDNSSARAKIQELASVYRPIKLDSFDKTATSFAEHVGASSASAEKKETLHHIDIFLKRRFQEKIKELISAFLPEKEKSSSESNLPAPPEGAPALKRLRLDKKVAFDLNSEQNGVLKLANIQGIFFDVGLWVKLKELVMIQEKQEDEPRVEVTAAAFGVEKTVKTDLPKSVFARLREGINKFDPFSQENLRGSENQQLESSSMSPASSNFLEDKPETQTINQEDLLHKYAE